MKKIIISMAAASLVATSAMAADKGIDFTTTGQAVVYYNTMGQTSDEMFNQDYSRANFGLQLDNVANLKNGFTLGSQLTYLTTVGLEKNLVSNTMQNTNNSVATENSISDDIFLSKLYLVKQVANTTVKIGRQELPKSLSPLAFSESWNVFKNTFDAAVVINTDLPKTTIVGAYVGKTSGNGIGNDMSSFNDLQVNGALDIKGPAYMLTVQNQSLEIATITASYYALKDIDVAESADAVWLDAKLAAKSMPMGLQVGLQAGAIMPEATGLDDTTAFGLKAGMNPVKPLTVCAAFSYVNDGTAHVVNTGTGVKTPLYTQTIGNQDAIKSDNSTVKLKAAYALGNMGNVLAQGTYTVDNSDAEQDTIDAELIYTAKVSGMDLLTGYIYNNKLDDKKAANNIVRVVARYKF